MQAKKATKRCKGDLMLQLMFLDKLDEVVRKFEEKHKCNIKYNIENLMIKKTK
jgi:hypothetical protein